MENNRIWLGKANIVASKFENKCIQKFDAHRIISILFLLTACWKCLALAMLDGCHHSWSFCDLLKAFKLTQQVRPEMTRDLLDLFQTTFTFINKFWVKTTDIVLSQCIPHLQAKEDFQFTRTYIALTQVSVTSNHMPFWRTFCVNLRQQVCKSTNGGFWLQNKQSVEQFLQRTLKSNDHLPKLNIENSVWSHFIPNGTNGLMREKLFFI